MAFLIDKYLPLYHYNEVHKKVIKAAAEKCFNEAKSLDFSKSFKIKILLELRGLPVKDLRLQEFLKNMCFTYLEEQVNKEFVIDASIRDIKIFRNFYFTLINEDKTEVSTETRILCLTKKSKFFFSIYWFFIKPLSGITRIEMLRLLKKQAEKNLSYQ